MLSSGMTVKIKKNKDSGEAVYSGLIGKISELQRNEARIILDKKSSEYITNYNNKKERYYTTVPSISIKNLTKINFIFGATE